jgi:hypothetical protein
MMVTASKQQARSETRLLRMMTTKMTDEGTTSTPASLLLVNTDKTAVQFVLCLPFSSDTSHSRSTDS